MPNLKKTLSLLMSALVICASLVSCSSKETAPEETGLSEEEINSRYEEIMNSSGEELLPEDYNPITDNFTTVDFQFTMTDDTTAFNLPENSYATITPTAANFSFFDTSVPGESFAGSFKTAKGLSLANTVAEFVAAYNVESGNALSLAADGSYAPYDGNATVSRVTFGFASTDGEAFSAIGSSELMRILQLRDPLFTSGSGISQADIGSIVSEYKTVALVDVAASETGYAGEITISRFDKDAQQ